MVFRSPRGRTPVAPSFEVTTQPNAAQYMTATAVLFAVAVFNFLMALLNAMAASLYRPEITVTPVAQLPRARPEDSRVARDGWRVVYDPRAKEGPIQSRWVARGDRERAEIEAALAQPYRLPQR